MQLSPTILQPHSPARQLAPRARPFCYNSLSIAKCGGALLAARADAAAEPGVTRGGPRAQFRTMLNSAGLRARKTPTINRNSCTGRLPHTGRRLPSNPSALSAAAVSPRIGCDKMAAGLAVLALALAVLGPAANACTLTGFTVGGNQNNFPTPTFNADETYQRYAVSGGVSRCAW